MADESTKTVLEPLRPNVVRRRIVVDIPTPAASAVSPREDEDEDEGESEDDDESPPSSVFVHPGYLAIGGGEDDDEEAMSVPSVRLPVVKLEEAPPASMRPTVKLDADATVATFAKQVGLQPPEVAAELMTRGFFSVTPRTRVSDELAPVLAQVYRCKIVQAEPVVAAPARAARPNPTKKKAAAAPASAPASGKRVAAKKRAAPKKSAKPTRRQRAGA